MRTKRFKTLVIALTTLVGAVTVSFNIRNNDGSKIMSSFFNKENPVSSEYAITLNNSNKVTSAGDRVNYTARGNKIRFAYENVASSTSGHVTFNAGGSMVNKDHVRSIVSFVATASTDKTIKFKTSFGGNVWSGETTLVNGQEYLLPSNPYFLSFSSISSVTLNSLKINYSCEVNPNAHEGESPKTTTYKKVTSTLSDYTGEYLVVYESDSTSGKAFNSGLETVDAANNYVDVTIFNNEIATSSEIESARVIVAKSSSGSAYTMKSSDGYYIGNTSNSNALNVSETNEYTNTFTYRDNTTFVTAQGNAVLRFNAATDQNRFRYYKTSSYSAQQIIQLYKKESGTSFIAPVDITGFSATDSNATTYTENSIFDSANNLVVKALSNDGKEQVLTKSQYSYKVLNSSGVEVDTSKAFNAYGNFKLVVSYGNFIPVEIPLTIAKVSVVTDVTLKIPGGTTFTTAQKLSDTISSLVTFDVTYSHSEDNKTNQPYSELANHDLAITLINPNGLDASINRIFAIAGTWQLKLYSKTTPSICSYQSFEVTSIDVTNVNLNLSTWNTYVGDTTTLVASVIPSNATDTSITWTNSNSSVVTCTNGSLKAIAVGTAIITAKSNSNPSVTATCTVTISNVAVTGVTLDVTSKTIYVGDKFTVRPTVLPANATNKNYTWSTVSGGNYASINSSTGEITGLAAGTATFKVTTQDGNKTATCVVTVEKKLTPTGWDLVESLSSLAVGDKVVLADPTSGTTAGNISNAIMPTVDTTFSSDSKSIPSLPSEAVILTVGKSGSNYTFANDDGALLGVTAVKKLAWDSGTTTWNVSISNSNCDIASTTSSYGTIYYNTNSPRFTTYASFTSSGMRHISLYKGGTAEPIPATGVSFSTTTLELLTGGSSKLTVNYTPANANTGKEVTWRSSNTSVATVTDGNITVSSTAVAGSAATITATLNSDSTKVASCVVTVTETPISEWTVLLYICGSDLESGNGFATSDIREILNVANKPKDVNFVIQTGGTKSWKYTGIGATKTQRWHVEDQSLVLDSTLNKANFGSSATLESFIEYGINNFPARKTGLILWNHGGGMEGVCYDSNYSNDVLMNDEVKTAVSNALRDTNTSGKLEFIGYDACLMQVQDIAEFNSAYFNYMVASEESESGYGWDYDTWVDDLYAKRSTETILKAMVDGFIADNGGTSSRNNDQTLSYLNLNNMAAYKVAFENMAAELATKINSGNKSAFQTLVKTAKTYSVDASQSELRFSLFDVKDFINKIAANSTFNPGSTYTNAVLTAHSNLVTYSSCGRGAGNSYGLCLYFSVGRLAYKSTNYASTQTNFSNWRSIVNSYGV